MNNSKRGFILVIILFVILVMVIVAGMIKEKRESKIHDQEYAKYIESEALAKKESEKVDESKVKGFVNKIKAKQNVKVLILGDDIAMSYGRNSEGGIWSDGLKNLIEATYGSKVEMKLSAKEGATAEKGLASVKENDFSDYDLIILCYGNSDSKASIKLEDVKTNYSNMIKKLKEKNPDSLMISILESSLELSNSYRLAVVEASTNNSVITADMKEAFNSSGKKESAISKNGFPNDLGYQIYTQTIGNKIREAVG